MSLTLPSCQGAALSHYHTIVLKADSMGHLLKLFTPFMLLVTMGAITSLRMFWGRVAVGLWRPNSFFLVFFSTVLYHLLSLKKSFFVTIKLSLPSFIY